MARREAIPAGLGNGARVLKRFHGVGWLFGCVVNVDDPRGIFTVVWSDAVSRDYEFREAWRMLDAGAAALPAGERAVPTVVSARGRGADAPGAGGAAEDSIVEGDFKAQMAFAKTTGNPPTGKHPPPWCTEGAVPFNVKR